MTKVDWTIKLELDMEIKIGLGCQKWIWIFANEEKDMKWITEQSEWIWKRF